MPVPDLRAAFVLFVMGAALGGCERIADAPVASAAPDAQLAEHHPLQFAQAACGGCHAVEAPWLSPNPASPSFADIANREGVTEATLHTYLVDAHNYPLEMDFDLDQGQARALAHYILSLRDPNYRPPPS
ncbi:hypothetical protein [Qipengyuania sp.]|uniref:hypothetical protein n=1 Tax=Qipengyuania sp. TaxID=2004515 RepID=UPI00373620AA